MPNVREAASSSAPAPASHLVHVPDYAAIAPDLARALTVPRPEAVSIVKDLRRRELAAIGAHQLAHLAELTGLDVTMQISGLTDAIVRCLAQRAFAKVGAPADWQSVVGLFAIGGYGRGEMNPFSDLDLLVLHDAGPGHPAWIDAGWAELQTLLWDVKFQVGASLRAVPELAGIIAEDFVTATAVVEGRPISAGPGLAARFTALLDDLRRRSATPFLRFKIDELAKRRSATGASLFLMEPNLKANPGGLRDVQLLRNIAFMAFGARNLLALEDLDAITRADLRDVVAANDHLLLVRSLLHTHHGRKQDVLLLADQVRVAAALGYGDVSRLRAVEHFMKQHYARVLHVHQILDLALSRLHAKGLLGPKPILVKSRKPLSPGFVAIAGRAYLAEADLWSREDAVLRLFDLALACQAGDIRLSFELQRAIRQQLNLVTPAVRRDRGIAERFLRLLGVVGKLRPILTDLHSCGLLGAYLPEFGNLTCHMQFTSYHQYTVDEHTLIAMGNLDAVANGTADGLPGMRRIFPTVERKDLLALSLLLHDMGKYMGRGHVPRGALMVAGVAERLGLTREEEDLVWFLVDRHVALSDASRMRNFREEAFLSAFAERMGSIARLDALYCLTWCDAKAVGEGVLTGWQEALIGELRLALVERLGEHSASVDSATPASLAERLRSELIAGGLSSADAAAFLDDLPNAYEYQLATGEAVRQAQVAAAARSSGVGMAQHVGERYIELTAAVPDRHGLFADVTAVLCGHGFDIIDARTWITRGGIVLYRFRLSSIFPARLSSDHAEQTWEALRRDLHAAGQGRIDAKAQLERRRKAMSGHKPADSGFDDPAVKVDSTMSERFTVVDVHARDDVGLLSRLCRAITDAGNEIGHACINTMGDVAVDVFYVQRSGEKLSDSEAANLRHALITALGLTTAR